MKHTLKREEEKEKKAEKQQEQVEEIRNGRQIGRKERKTYYTTPIKSNQFMGKFKGKGDEGRAERIYT